MIEQHHLLECILWPNGDGTFRKIINTWKRLDELGIYKDYKLTIPLESSIHKTMHNEFKRGTEYSNEGINNPMYGRSEEKNPYWKGDNVLPFTLYRRASKRYKRGEISEEEFQKFRDLAAKDIKERIHNKCQR